MNQKEIELRLKGALCPINNAFGNSILFTKKYRSIKKLDAMLLERCEKYNLEIDSIQRKYKHMSIDNDYKTFELVNMAIGCLGNKASSFGTSYCVAHDKNLHRELKKRLEKIGPIGTSPSSGKTSNIIGKCAEVKAANPVLRGEKGICIINLKFTPARRPRTLQKHRTCSNCQETFGLTE
ncbi:hypothetical protein [Aeromonas caviae]|uniref:hypothetical protein n=1 Tax=Aeromonas caviae TaxID=648 RepID=UPI0038D11289